MNKIKKNGFTLIELIIYASVFIVISIILTTFIMNLIKVQTKSRIKKHVLDNSQRAMEIMTWEIKHAQAIYNSTNVDGSHPGQLSLRTQYNLPDNEETTYIDFYLDDNEHICFKRENTEGMLLTSEDIKINNLVFNFITAGDTQSVQINLTAIYDNTSAKTAYNATTTLTSSAVLRNE
ncbi:type II secretion system protein J [Patescibacteria group bacterium]